MPRLTTPAKSFAADYCIVLDDVQFARRNCRHRCRLATLGDPGQQRWLSIPPHSRFTTDRDSTRVPRRSVQTIRRNRAPVGDGAGLATLLDHPASQAEAPGTSAQTEP
ncbi:hypothetical protein EYS09_08745 [Streptomyces kasugaensis]|uniref:Uncharacterized protein n=1 Tax=Streptomyces kasugaensis TaxID=1946 RepID=A0A4Q9HXP4_STRKA|nr:hypothetical protein EYS09_08745 [Streptomyces kasugaensis]